MTVTTVEMKRSEPYANLLAGGVGGLASLVVGHPFDTVKVRLQTMKAKGGGSSLPYANARDCFLKIVRHEGVCGLFKGMSALAVFSVPRFALMFYANTWGRIIAQNPEDSQLTLKHILLGGVISQMVIAPTITAPLERVKVLLQVHPKKFTGQVDCLSYILKTEGFSGVFRGSLLTLARDIPAFCSYFATYELLRSLVKSDDGRMSLGATAVIGGLSGVVGWGVEIPADNIKNRHQVCLGQKPLINTVREVIAEGGVRQLYRGAGVILLRAFPANAATFIGYEWTIRGLILVDL
eukprot:TRINITY_DN5430_c0_g1_i1.p1 TRINITY_DN5430_c0_g1~~TRINITY_DN5430_c0_g1_i1.p1  ORF type:complete len:294 (+),score=70.37 TRINITY_DN5430_c0_g1_i1:52-933(+)